VEVKQSQWVGESRVLTLIATAHGRLSRARLSAEDLVLVGCGLQL